MDSLFRDLFQDKRYAAELNMALLVDKSITEKDVNIDSLQIIDEEEAAKAVAFKVKGHSVLTLAENDEIRGDMPALMFIHYTKVLDRDHHAQIFYGNTPLKLEMPVHCVFYFGDEDLEPESEMIIGKKCGGFYFGITVYNANKIEQIPELRECKSLLEYRRLVDTFKYYSKILWTAEDVADATIKKCLAQGILDDYLVANKDKVKTIMKDHYAEN